MPRLNALSPYAGLTTFRRLLKEQLPAVAMGAASSSTDDHDFPPGALHIEGWPNCRADIRNWLLSNPDAQLDTQVEVAWAKGRYSPGTIAFFLLSGLAQLAAI